MAEGVGCRGREGDRRTVTRVKVLYAEVIKTAISYSETKRYMYKEV